jgi:hypothetical protein
MLLLYIVWGFFAVVSLAVFGALFDLMYFDRCRFQRGLKRKPMALI